MKTNDQSTRNLSRHRNEKFRFLLFYFHFLIEIYICIRLSKVEQDELDLALQLSKEMIQRNEISDDQTSKSTVSSHGK